jgi:glycine/D-amino acid oxidase-like deaminating enzyme
LHNLAVSSRPQHAVFWQLQQDVAPRGRLDRDRSADTVVVGGGMAGLMCALRLAQAGQSVVLLERHLCGGGATGRSSGFVTPDSELELNQLVARWGAVAAKRLWELVTSGVESIRAAVEQFQIPCDLREQDSLFIANSASRIPSVAAEHEARTRFGYASRLYRREELAGVIGSDAFHGAVRYSGTLAINAFRFCRTMRDVLEAQGVLVCEQTEVTNIDAGAVRAGPHTVHARSIAVWPITVFRGHWAKSPEPFIRFRPSSR